MQKTIPTKTTSSDKASAPKVPPVPVNMGARGYDSKKSSISANRKQNAVNALGEMQGVLITYADAYPDTEDDVKLAYFALERISIKLLK